MIIIVAGDEVPAGGRLEGVLHPRPQHGATRVRGAGPGDRIVLYLCKLPRNFDLNITLYCVVGAGVRGSAEGRQPQRVGRPGRGGGPQGHADMTTWRLRSNKDFLFFPNFIHFVFFRKGFGHIQINI